MTSLRVQRTNFALLVAGSAIVTTIITAPAASADPNQSEEPRQSCAAAGSSSTVCQAPGDVEINDSPPPVSFYPYGGESGLL
jgi:hypothetical protein